MADFSTVATSVIVTLGIQTLYYLVMSFPDQLHRTDPKRKNYAALKLRNLVCGGSLEGREEPLIWASVDTAKRRFCGYCGRRSSQPHAAEEKTAIEGRNNNPSTLLLEALT